MHINEMNIDWNSKPRESKEDEDPMRSISDAEDDLLKLGEVNQMPPLIRFEIIVPTWSDVNVPEPTTVFLTGLFVADDDPENSNVLQDSIDIAVDLPALRKFRQGVN